MPVERSSWGLYSSNSALREREMKIYISMRVYLCVDKGRAPEKSWWTPFPDSEENQDWLKEKMHKAAKISAGRSLQTVDIANWIHIQVIPKFQFLWCLHRRPSHLLAGGSEQSVLFAESCWALRERWQFFLTQNSMRIHERNVCAKL